MHHNSTLGPCECMALLTLPFISDSWLKSCDPYMKFKILLVVLVNRMKLIASSFYQVYDGIHQFHLSEAVFSESNTTYCNARTDWCVFTMATLIKLFEVSRNCDSPIWIYQFFYKEILFTVPKGGGGDTVRPLSL